MHRPFVLSLILACAAVTGRADFKSDVGFTDLQSEFGASLPTGSNIRVAQIEWREGSGEWAPQAAADLVGKTFNFFSIPTGTSTHANGVGGYFYGSGSMTPGISTVYSFESIDYLFYSLGIADILRPATWEVENHSYSGATNAFDLQGTRTLDYRIKRDNVVACFSLDNTTGGLWPMYHQGYNGIVVGTETGNHSRGTTMFAAAGRVKPDIVGTATWTSYCAPMVASSAALLRSKAKLDSSLNAADNALVVKALLLAGADKSPFPGWNRTDTRPLDSVFGAGRVHIGNSYRTLVAGRGAASTSSLVSATGWDAGTSASGSKWYYFQVTGSSAVPFSAALTWYVDSNLLTWGYSLTNLNLKLYNASGFSAGTLVSQSVSTVDNVEHIYVASLNPGYYALEVTSPSAGEAYGLAWRAAGITSGGGTPPPTAPSISSHPSSLTVTAGASASFSVTASGSGTLSYQWRKDGSNIGGATGASYSISSTTTGDAGSYSVVVTNSAGSVTSNTASLTVNPAATAPSISTHPASQSVTAGATVNFAVTASGSGTLSYQWRKDGSNISGATSWTLALSSVTTGDAGSYSVVVTNSAGSVTSNAATLTVSPAPTAPSISSHPSSVTVTDGGSASFSVTASGTGPLSYQWRKDGSNIAGATSSTYSLSGINSGHAGSYTVVVSNSAGSVTSNAASLTVTAAATAPSISSHPSSVTVTDGGSASFSVSASGTGPLSYQWRKDGSNIAGATSSTYSLSGINSGHAGSYTVVVSNSAGSVTSNAASLTVTAAATAPSISAQPASVTVTTGGTATFSVTASGTGPLSYTWRKDGSVISGATSSTLSLSSVSSGSAGWYGVAITNSAGTTYSDSAYLTVTAAPTAPSISSHPVSQTITAGNSVTFSVTASGSGTLTYQWRKDGSNISGATSSSYSISSVNSGHAGSYTVVVTNSAGSTTSNAATLTVTAAATAPSISAQPVSTTVTSGATATFSVTASGTGPLSYTWRKDGAVISGATSSTLSLASVSSGSAGWYGVAITNSAGTTYSDSAYLTVSAAASGAPTISTHPVSQTAALGGSVFFSVTATGSNLNYQWYKNGAALSGQTGATLTIPGLKGSDAGSYTVVVSNSGGSVTSNAASLTLTSKKQTMRALATRAEVGTGSDVLVSGFVIQGSEPKRLLVRAVGPKLAEYGVGGTLAAPVLTVFNGPTEIASNQGWNKNSNAAEIRSLSEVVGAFPLGEGSNDCAVLLTFNPGLYTVQVQGLGGSKGVALIEMYDIDAGDNSTLKAISSRAIVGTGANNLIPSLVVTGEGTKTVLVRAIGPHLAKYEVAGALMRPNLIVHKLGTGPIASNQGWGNNANPATIASVADSVGAFPLDPGSNDCALLLTLEAGAYTFNVSGVADTTGVALVEVYEL